MAPDYSVNTKGPAIEETREFIITYILTFMFIVLFTVPFKTYFIYILWNLRQLCVLVGIFLQPLYIGHKIIGLYQGAHEAGKFQASTPKTQEKKLKRLGKADNIPHNQLYYVAENCADWYYSKVIETFTLLLKRQFANRQLLLINTARSLKFLEE